MGKTFLLGRLREAAEQHGLLTAGTNESVYGVVEAMATLAEQLEGQGVKLKRFAHLHTAYRKREAGGSDVAGLVTRAATKLTTGAVNTLVPGASIVTKSIDPDQVNQLREAAMDGLLRRDDQRLAAAPVDELSPAFVEGLREADRPLALFFDTYERTGAYLDDWLRAIFEGRYGEAPADLVVTVAGRQPLDPLRWAPYLGVLADLPLAAFTEVEVRQLLRTKAIDDEAVIEVITAVAGGLPLAVATLAEQRPSRPGAVKDLSGGLVDRFLQWESDPVRRDLAQVAALPRKIDQDLVAVLAEGEVAELYGWLHAQSFVSREGGVCRYHDVVREPMIRLNRTRSPRRWEEIHLKLAEAYRERRERPGLSEEGGDSCLLEECYHRLCADPVGSLPEVLSHVVEGGLFSARRWAEVFTSAGNDAAASSLRALGESLQDALLGERPAGAYLDLLIQRRDLPENALKEACRQRGVLDRDEKRYDSALACFTRATTMDPDFEKAVAGRGETYRLAGRHEEALADFDRAVELAPDDAWNHLHRGWTLNAMGRRDEALADLTRAVELRPHDPWYLAQRGMLFKSVDDLSQAIELDPGYEWALAIRGDLHRQKGRYDEALADFDRAVELAPDDAWNRLYRGLTYEAMGRLEEALDDLGRVMEIDPDYWWAQLNQGRILRNRGRLDEAMAVLDEAVRLRPHLGSVYNERARAHAVLGRHEEALADFDRALARDPDEADTIANRALSLRLLGRLDEAVDDFTRALDLGPDDAWSLGHRAVALRELGRREEALSDFTRAIELEPHDDSFALERFMTCGIAFLAGHDYQWVADLDATEREGRTLARTAREWMTASGLIAAEVRPFPLDAYGLHARTGEQVRRPSGVSFHWGRVICYPMKAESAACPGCGHVTILRRDGVATADWDGFVTPIYNWFSVDRLTRSCESCNAEASLRDWVLDQPWAFPHLALRFWNWPPLTGDFLATLADKLGGHRLTVISGRR
ncbi:tetratricopeptide repeat protein [Nonomuraea roseola]